MEELYAIPTQLSALLQSVRKRLAAYDALRADHARLMAANASLIARTNALEAELAAARAELTVRAEPAGERAAPAAAQASTVAVQGPRLAPSDHPSHAVEVFRTHLRILATMGLRIDPVAEAMQIVAAPGCVAEALVRLWAERNVLASALVWGRTGSMMIGPDLELRVSLRPDNTRDVVIVRTNTQDPG